MRKLSIIAVVALLILSALNCNSIFTSIQLGPGQRDRDNQQYFSSELVLNSDLIIDDWVQEIAIMRERNTRGQERVRSQSFSCELSFFTSGKISFDNGKIHNGRYRLFADTLVAYFDDQSDIEKYLFHIKEDQLTLTGLWKYEYAAYTLIGNNTAIYDRYEIE